MSSAAIARFLLRFAWVVPLAFLAAMRWGFTLDFPMLDQWELPLLLQRWHDGTLDAAALFAQHNEHRPAVPRLLMLALARVTQWDVRAETNLTLLLGLALFGVLAAQARARLAYASAPRRHAVALVISTLVFSLAAWRNWFLGWQLQLVLSVLLAVLTLHALTHAELTRRRFTYALLLAVLNTYAFANALLVWPLGLVVLLGRCWPAWRERRKYAALWTATGVVLCTAYFWDFSIPASQEDAPGGIRLLAFAGYAFAYLGAPLAFWIPLAIALGAAGVARLAMVARGYARPTATTTLEGRAYPRATLTQWANGPDAFWYALALYALGTAALSAVARHDYGIAQALSSRYTTIGMLLWVSVAVLNAAHAKRRTWPVLVVIALFAAAASLHGAYRWTEHWAAYSTARPSLEAVEHGPGLQYLYPDEEELLRRAAWLRVHRLSIWGDI
ncbi:MAG: hypothetical protein GC168_02095 [Candidatus Hydrogenedens sp.]|nr:hypothetical protein [Candidatus Hydrogenedens sp.]